MASSIINWQFFNYPQLDLLTCTGQNVDPSNPLWMCGLNQPGEQIYNNPNNINALQQSFPNTLLGRFSIKYKPYETVPLPLTTENNITCTTQNQRFTTNTEVSRHTIRKAFGNYIINDTNGNSVFQLFNSPILAEDTPIQIPAPGENPIGPGYYGSLTPFRKAFNAGDPLNRFNVLPNSKIYENVNGLATSISPANQVQGSRRAANQAAASTAGSARRVSENGSAYTGNPRFVYDGSDYTRYLKLKAQNNNYNDPTYGGDDHHASQSALAKVRH